MVIVLPKATGRKPKKSRERNRKLLQQRRRRLLDRIANYPGPERDVPMISASNIHYELGERVQGFSAGGLGAVLLVARSTGLISGIDHELPLLKRHLPCQKPRTHSA